MAFRQMRYRYEDGVMLKNIFPSDTDMNGWSLDQDTAMKGPQPEMKEDGDSSGHSVRSSGASKSKTDKREPSSDEPI